MLLWCPEQSLSWLIANQLVIGDIALGAIMLRLLRSTWLSATLG